MTTSTRKLIATVSTAAALLITSVAVAKATGGHTGQHNGRTGSPGAANTLTSNSLQQQSLSRGLQKRQQLKHKDDQEQPGSEMAH